MTKAAIDRRRQTLLAFSAHLDNGAMHDLDVYTGPVVTWVSKLFDRRSDPVMIATKAGAMVWCNEAYRMQPLRTLDGAEVVALPPPNDDLLLAQFPDSAARLAGRAERLEATVLRVINDLQSLPSVLAANGADERRAQPLPLPADLLGRRREVAELAVSGMTVEAIAERLTISPNTVRNHLKAVFRAVQAHSRAELIARYHC